MRRLLISVAVVLALAGAAQAAQDASRAPLVATIGRGLDWHVVRLDPLSLKTLPGWSQTVGLQYDENVLSPDRSWLAVGRNGPDLRLVQVGATRANHWVSFPRASVHPLAWISTRVLVVEVDSVVAGRFTRTLVGVDAGTRNVLWRRALGETEILGTGRVRDRLILLVGPAAGAGTPSILAVSASGALRSAEVERVPAGLYKDASGASLARKPGLAVDAAANRAYVVGAGAPLAQIDLSRMTVAYRGGDRTLAKLMPGPERRAVWLGNGKLAVTGYDSSSSSLPGGLLRYTKTPIGLSIVDVESGATRLVKRDVGSVLLVGRSLVTFGTASDSTVRNETGYGLSVLGLDGAERLHLFGSTPVSEVQAQGGLAYVSLTDRSGHFVVVDADAGRVVANVTRPAVRLVTAR